jgi:hypothetical protein
MANVNGTDTVRASYGQSMESCADEDYFLESMMSLFESTPAIPKIRASSTVIGHWQILVHDLWPAQFSFVPLIASICIAITIYD